MQYTVLPLLILIGIPIEFDSTNPINGHGGARLNCKLCIDCPSIIAMRYSMGLGKHISKGYCPSLIMLIS